MQNFSNPSPEARNEGTWKCGGLLDPDAGLERPLPSVTSSCNYPQSTVQRGKSRKWLLSDERTEQDGVYNPKYLWPPTKLMSQDLVVKQFVVVLVFDGHVNQESPRPERTLPELFGRLRVSKGGVNKIKK